MLARDWDLPGVADDPVSLAAVLPHLNLTESSAAIRPWDWEIEPAQSDPESPPQQTRQIIETPQGAVWISGNAVMCVCPACQAPVSIRLWLMVADCWNCDSAMELSYQQQRAAEKLAEQLPAASSQSERSHSLPAADPEADPQPLSPASLAPLVPPERPRRLVHLIHKLTNTLPAWLISLLVHLVLLLILALILLPTSQQSPTITLATAVGPRDEIGGADLQAVEELPLEFDSITPPDAERIERELKKVEVAAAEDARELLIDPHPVLDLPDLERIKRSVTESPQSRYTLAIRDPRLRNEIVTREGGTTLSEAAVSRGLRWLARVQNQDGSWSLAKYKRHADPQNEGDMAATSLALLPFLGAGQTHEYGLYKENVARGLKWMLEHQMPNGELTFGIRTNAAIYAHGQAAIVLVETLAMSGDEQFREPAQRAIDYIEGFQHKHGGWRYRPGEAGDTSVMGWQLMALQSARLSNTGLQVADSTLMLASQYLDLASRSYLDRDFREAPSGTLYRYQPGDRAPKAAMTAEGILCRMYLGWKRNDAKMLYAVDWLIDNALPSLQTKKHNLYYYYYATQVMHHFGGQHWETWNRHLRDLLIIQQERRGRYAGSWDPQNYHYGGSGGRIYTTAMAICTLEVYYRHLPLFKKLDLE